MEKGRTKKQKNLSYIGLIKRSTLHPKHYAQTISEFSDPKEALLFFVANFSLGFFIRICFNGISHENFGFFFLGIDSLLLSIPFLLLFLVVLVLIFYGLSKILRGKATLTKTLIISSYCSIPFLILAWIPLLGILALLETLLILILSFQVINQFSIPKSMVTILIPFLFSILALILLGLINPVLNNIFFF